jgi:hypothetical protein
MPAQYEEQFVGYIDFLGFSEASKDSDERKRLQILQLLQGLAAGRGEFDIKSTTEGTLRNTNMRAAVSTFSDHVVVSYPLAAVRNDVPEGERVVAIHVLSHFGQLVTAVAVAALRIGFLIRGGASIGFLYHSQGVIFGPALIDAYMIESRTSVYPRVVLSPSVTSKQDWLLMSSLMVAKDDDGLHHVDYFNVMTNVAVQPGPTYNVEIKRWFTETVSTVNKNLRELKQEGRLNELAKWTWFARRFHVLIENLPQPLLDGWGISLSDIPW